MLVTNDSTDDTTREMCWDEDNRLMVLSDNGKTSRYTYNAGGERIIKSHGDLEGVYIKDAPAWNHPFAIADFSASRMQNKRVCSAIGLH